MEITMSEEGVIFCNGIMCDPLGLYCTGAECGSCPIISLAEEFCNIKFELAY